MKGSIEREEESSIEGTYRGEGYNGPRNLDTKRAANKVGQEP